MKWCELMPCLNELLMVRKCPDVLLIHLGENVLVQLSGLVLFMEMKSDLELIVRFCVKTKLFDGACENFYSCCKGMETG